MYLPSLQLSLLPPITTTVTTTVTTTSHHYNCHYYLPSLQLSLLPPITTTVTTTSHHYNCHYNCHYYLPSLQLSLLPPITTTVYYLPPCSLQLSLRPHMPLLDRLWICNCSKCTCTVMPASNVTCELSCSLSTMVENGFD